MALECGNENFNEVRVCGATKKLKGGASKQNFDWPLMSTLAELFTVYLRKKLDRDILDLAAGAHCGRD